MLENRNNITQLGKRNINYFMNSSENENETSDSSVYGKQITSIKEIIKYI